MVLKDIMVTLLLKNICGSKCSGPFMWEDVGEETQESEWELSDENTNLTFN